MLKIIILCLAFLALIICLCGIIITSCVYVSETCMRCYMYIIEHRDYKKWEKFLDMADKFEFAYEFKNSKTFIYDKYEAIIWDRDENLTSIHYKDGTCILSTFDYYHSRKMTEKLLNKMK